MSPARLPVLASPVLAPVLAVPSASARIPADLDAADEWHVPEITALRHRIHQNPDLSNLGTASVLAHMREELAGTLLFIFRPAEEGTQVGELGVMSGPAMAASDRWTAQIVARQAHGAQPQESVDHPTMTADDSAIPVGIRAMTALVLDYTGGDGG